MSDRVMDDNNPLVTVGVPTYNNPDGLRRTLENITTQTYRNLEIIISDNCSQGLQTGEVIRSFVERDCRIQHYRQEENIGPTPNFQFVIEKATGEYFMMAADDDEWSPIFIEKCLQELFSNPKAILCYSEPYFRDYKGWGLYHYECDITSDSDSPIKRASKILMKEQIFTSFYGLHRTSVLRQVPWFERFGYDQVVVLSLTILGKIVKTDKGLFTYGTEGISATTQKLLKNQKINMKKQYFLQLSVMKNMLKAVSSSQLNLCLYEKLILFVLIFYRYIMLKERRHAIIYGFEAYIGDKLRT